MSRSAAHPTRGPIRRRRDGLRTGFSLTEVLIAILILGIGVVSIASLLPVGISQQQRAGDDILAPIVARNALATIRSRVQSAQFGVGYRFQEVADPTSPSGFRTVINAEPWVSRGYALGDWGWLRPAFVPANAISTLPDGGIDIFNQLELTGLVGNAFDEQDVDGFLGDTGIPLNPDFPVTLPTAGVISQGERVYPAFSDRPQYAWECMFRRRNGRVQVAVMVYRIVSDAADGDPYIVSLPAGQNGPPLPHRVDLADGGPEPWRGAFWDAYDTGTGLPLRVIPNTGEGNPFDFANPDHHWQAPGQQLLDQSGTVHRVLFGHVDENDGPVELARPVQEIPLISASPLLGNANFRDQVFLNGFSGRYEAGRNGWWDTGVVSQLWYMPIIDADGRQLVPVYVQVEEL
jgi:prepilin-type N-terminal cleavage/methylation domain-containing protein